MVVICRCEFKLTGELIGICWLKNVNAKCFDNTFPAHVTYVWWQFKLIC